MHRLDLRREMGRKLGDTRQRLALAIEPRRPEPEERLIVSKVLRQSAVAEYVPVVSADGKDRRSRSSRLQRHDGARLTGRGLSRVEKSDNFPLAFA